MTVCPKCGYADDEMTALSVPGRVYEGRAGRWSSVDVVEPVQDVSVVADVVVPALQALFSGGLGALVLGVAGVPWQVVVAGFAVVVAGVWALVLRRPARVQHYRREDPGSTDSMELWVGEGPGNGETIGAGGHLRRSVLPGRRRLRAVWRDVELGKRRFSARSLRGCDGMSQGEASDVLEAMVKAGLLAYRDGKRNHPSGAIMTEAGKAFGVRLRGD